MWKEVRERTESKFEDCETVRKKPELELLLAGTRCFLLQFPIISIISKDQSGFTHCSTKDISCFLYLLLQPMLLYYLYAYEYTKILLYGNALIAELLFKNCVHLHLGRYLTKASVVCATHKSVVEMPVYVPDLALDSRITLCCLLAFS